MDVTNHNLPMLPLNLESIEATHLQALVSDQVPEGATSDFKEAVELSTWWLRPTFGG